MPGRGDADRHRIGHWPIPGGSQPIERLAHPLRTYARGRAALVAGLLLQPSLKSMVSFGILILVLLLRPQGLFGRAT